MNTVTIETHEYLGLLKARKYFELVAPILDDVEKLRLSDGAFTNKFVKVQDDLEKTKLKIKALDELFL